MEELGKKLLAEREIRKISLHDISNATHISIAVLKDIEAGHFDKYEGDEQYIKKYIKKYADYLGIDSTDLIESYVTITQELSLTKLKEREEKLKVEPKPKKVVTKIAKPAYAKSQKVYDNNSGRTFVRYTLIIALCLLIIFSVWYAMRLSSDNNADFKDPNQNHITGTPSVDEDKDNVEDTPPTPEPEKKPEEDKVVMNRLNQNQYEIKIPASMESFTFKIDFVSYTWSSMSVNGQPYSQFAGKGYNSANQANDKNATPETVSLTFNSKDIQTMTLSNGFNLYHRYYINDTLLAVPETDQVGTYADVIFTFVKE